jgi:4-hydroxy-tetrahydrodipicolinate synthase
MSDIGRQLTAMLTPFRDDGSLNLDAAQALARRLCEDGSDGIVVAGTTGEAPTLSDDEKIELATAVRAAIGRDHTVLVGTGGNDTRHSVELSERAIGAGADALLCVVPYYSKPSQEGMYRHFAAIAEVGPVIMYNIQGRTGVNMTAETTLRCAALPGVIGVKEASANIDQMGFVCAGAPDGFRVWSGDDSFTLPLLAVGGYGVIGVTTHLAGSAMRRMIEAFVAGDHATATALHHRLLPLIKAVMTTASNPLPIKTAVARLGFAAGPFRLPLAPLADAEEATVMAAVRAAGDLITFGGAVGATR